MEHYDVSSVGLEVFTYKMCNNLYKRLLYCILRRGCIPGEINQARFNSTGEADAIIDISFLCCAATSR